jgi:hypothetical protein
MEARQQQHTPGGNKILFGSRRRTGVGQCKMLKVRNPLQNAKSEESIREGNFMPKKARLHMVSNAESPVAVAGTTPVGLGADGLALWRQVNAEYALDDVGGVLLLTQACRALDRAESCRRRIDKDGEIVDGREHPLLKAEMAARSFVCRTIAKLGLSFEPVRTAVGRPPGGYA